MTKKLLGIVIVSCMFLSFLPMTAEAEAGTCGGDLRWELDDAGVLTISGTGAMTEWQDFGEADWNDVKQDIRAVVIEEGVTTVGNYAFWDCLNITSVKLPQSLTYIGKAAFIYCEKLTSLKVPPKVAGIGNAAFVHCSALQSIRIPEATIEIGETPFYGCENLSVIYYGGSSEQWDAVIWGDDDHYPEYTSVCFNSYYTGPSGETSGTCGEDLLWKLDEAGVLTISGTGAMTDYDDWTDVPWFDNTEAISRAVIGDGVTCIGDHAFMNCFNMEQIDLPESLERIGKRSFEFCSSIKEISLPVALNAIDRGAFGYCKKLADIRYGGRQSHWNEISLAEGDNSLTGVTLHFSDGKTASVPLNMGPVTSKGRCGPDVYWQKDAYGTLRIYGSGSTYDFKRTGTYNVGDEDFFPTWIFKEPAAVCVVIDEGVTRIGRAAFTNVPRIIENTFSVYIDDISDLYYIGTNEQLSEFLENSSDSYNELLDHAAVRVIRSPKEQPVSAAEISDVQVSGSTVSCTISVTESSSAWFAVYDENGRFLGAESRALLADTENELTFTADNDSAANFGIFVFSDSFTPLCSASCGCLGVISGGSR
ncbi:MAG: leucine-rich repeat domain-containing protein [Clostridia bacterium]|nr:leucine-rich repeat domain-containing protein [Clostridia bacterium]